MLQTNVKGPLVLAGIVIGLSLVIGLGGSWYLGSLLKAEAASIVAARVESSRIATLGPRLAALKAQEATAAGYQRALSLLLPTQEQLLEVPRAVEQLARTHQVEGQFAFLGSPPAGPSPAGAALPFSFSGSGAIASLTDFLDDLESRNPRYTVRIGQAEIAADSEGTARLSVTGDLYYR